MTAAHFTIYFTVHLQKNSLLQVNTHSLAVVLACTHFTACKVKKTDSMYASDSGTATASKVPQEHEQ